jgi:hypothetical protein
VKLVEAQNTIYDKDITLKDQNLMDEFSTKSECSDQESVPTRHSNMELSEQRRGRELGEPNAAVRIPMPE